MNIEKWLNENTKDLKGKTIIVTGSTGGLGGNVAKALAFLNANLILADRNQEKSKKLEEEIRNINQEIKITRLKLDFTNLQSLKTCCDDLKKMEQVDGIIFSAGVYSLKFTPSKEDYNVIFKTNFLYPYYFMKMLIPILRKSNFAKVVIVGSISYKFAKLNEEDVDYSYEKSSNKIYGNSKRWMMSCFTELLKDEVKIDFSIAHPGITPTNITRNYPKALRAIIKYPMKIIFSSPKHASLPIIKAIFSKTCPYEWWGPGKADIWGKPQKKKIKKLDELESKRMFFLAEEMCKKLDKQLENQAK